VVVARVPFPVASPDQVVDAVLGVAGSRVRLAVLDHVTSHTGLVWPIVELISELSARGIDTLVDGAHAPGMVPLHLDALGAAYYVGNCHKWLCSPKGAGFLYVRRDRQEGIVPTTISAGASSKRRDRSRFRLLFDWTGTSDPSAALSVPAALAFLPSLVPGGWPGVMSANRTLALRARDVLCDALGIERPAPDAMLGSMAAVPLPDGQLPAQEDQVDPLQADLWEEDRIEAAVFSWGDPPKRILRVSTHLYNAPEELAFLVNAIRKRL